MLKREEGVEEGGKRRQEKRVAGFPSAKMCCTLRSVVAFGIILAVIDIVSVALLFVLCCCVLCCSVVLRVCVAVVIFCVCVAVCVDVVFYVVV